MKKIQLFALAFGAVMVFGCGGNGQNGQNNTQNGDDQETTDVVATTETKTDAEADAKATEELIILKAWQNAAVENFLCEYDNAKTGLTGRFSEVMDEALEHDLDWSDYEDAFEKAMKTMDEYRDKSILELSNAQPYDVPEQEYLDWNTLLDDMIGEHGDTTEPSLLMLDYMFHAMRDNAVFCTPPPATDVEIFDEDEVIEFLKKVYPNSVKGEDLPGVENVTTERFREWCGLVCDYDPVYMTQDAYAYNRLPNPTYAPYKPYPNAYAVSWERYEEAENVVNFVVVTKVDDEYKIDNILSVEGAHCFLLFNYAVKPESIWAD